MFCCSCLQLIRDLKDEISKLRDFIRAEGLEGKVSAFGMYIRMFANGDNIKVFCIVLQGFQVLLHNSSSRVNSKVV